MLKVNFIVVIFIYTSTLFSLDKKEERIITIGGSVTEIVFALNQGFRVVAVDQSSTIPTQVNDLPQVGYIRAISTEGILSMEPTKIITTSDMGPPNVVSQLKSSGVELVIFKSPKSYADIVELVKLIGAELDATTESVKLIESMEVSYNSIKSDIAKQTKSPNIAFFMGMGGGSTLSAFNAAGSGTRANYLIEFIGGNNIFKDSFKKYSKVDSETLINLNPDIILLASMGSHNQIIENIENDKYLQYINAVKKDQIHFIELGKSLTFGSNFVDSAADIANKVSGKK